LAQPGRDLQRLTERVGCAEGRITSRSLHAYIRDEIVSILDGRSWNWLAKASGVPQSTLAQQVARPKFSVDTLFRVCGPLGIDVSTLFPPFARVDRPDQGPL
jgi:hypothetical protein